MVLHSLQVGSDATKLDPWRDQRGVVDHSDQLQDFYDTSCVISQLDLVISVDTAVAHLAGALDVPVWTMLQHNSDFRWMRGRSDSPWYRSMTLIRQRSLIGTVFWNKSTIIWCVFLVLCRRGQSS